jgi:hypothetical protein
MSAMSTPINQLNPNFNGQNGQNVPNLEEDPMVMGVIDEMEQEVSYKQQPSITSTNVASFKPPPQQHQMHNGHNGHNGHSVQKEEPLLAWNQEDAQAALLLAFVAFCVFYPCDTSAYYEKFDFTRNMKSYDLFVRLALLTVLVYFITRKLKT